MNEAWKEPRRTTTDYKNGVGRARLSNWGVGVLLLLLSLSTTVTAQIQIQDVRAGSMTLSWSAPGDDSIRGTATRYEIRVAELLIDNSNWSAADTLSGTPAPQPGGTPETFIVYDNDLPVTTGSFVAIKAVDDAGLWSPLSNNIEILETPSLSPAEVGADSQSVTLYCQTLADQPSATYRFELDTLNSFATAQSRTGVISGSTAQTTFSSLASNGVYYFRCRAVVAAATQSSFYTSTRQIDLSTGIENIQPTSPSPMAPDQDSMISGQTPTLTVLNGYDEDGDPLTYEFVIFETDSVTVVGSVTNLAEGTDSTTSWTVPDGTLLNDNSYLWQARCNDSITTSSWTPLYRFTITDIVSNFATSVRDPYPSPVHPEAGERLVFELPNELVTVKILDSTGELVFRQPGLSGLWQWDGRNGNGHIVVPGIYIWIVSGNRGSGKFLVSR